MVEHAAGAAGGAAWGIIGSLWRCLRYKFVNVELRLEQGDSCGPKPKRPKAPGRKVAWWGEIVIESNAPETIREYHVVLTLPKDVFDQWSIGYPTIENTGSPIWQSRRQHSQYELIVGTELPIIPRTRTTVGEYEWMVASSHDQQPRYIVAYEIAVGRRKWTGQWPLEMIDE